MDRIVADKNATALACPDVEKFSLFIEVLTQTGSRYYLGLDDQGRWWMWGDNVPSPTSARLSSTWWEIEQPDPWPILLGGSVTFRAPRDWAPDDPRRIPGGGKRTSSVSMIRVLRGDAEFVFPGRV